jgi:hypothetical protein
MARAWVRRCRWPVAVGATLALAACGSTGGGGTATSPSVEPSASAGAARCDAGTLRAAPGRGSAATGHVSRVLQLTNTSDGPCTLMGYPDLQRLDTNGGPVPTKVVHGGGFSFPDQPPSRVQLAAGATASFTADWASATGYPEGCPPESATLRITPPDTTGTLTTDIPIRACPDGTIHVSPVVPGPDGLHR